MKNNVETAKNIIINEDFNLFKVLSSRENTNNPYPVYKKLREYDPVFYMKSPMGFLSEDLWIVTKYDHISSVLINKKFGRGNRFGKSKITAQNYSKLNALTQMRQHWVNFLDPPDHTRIRSFLNKVMSVKLTANLKPNIESIAKYLIDKIRSGDAKDDFELIRDFSYPLATLTVAEMYGTPKEDRDILDKWGSQVVRTLDVVTSQYTQEDLQLIYKSAEEIKDYFRKVVEERAANPEKYDDLISKLLTVRDNDDKLSVEEITSTLVLLTMDAHEAPKNLITNGIYALLRNPDQFDKLKNNPALIESAVDEFLRYDSPAQFTGRRTNEDEIVGGKEIKKGIQIICMLGAGNRDPEKFENPDTLDIERKNVIPLSFGGGIHYCAGAGLGRLEAEIGINSLLENFPEMKLKDKEYNYHASLHSRGLESLELSLNI
ncbi:MAG: cytochrome P450 [Ignavibacteria bacterium]|nr:cytochrome P450 [Ignavibacteria bacterium]MBK9405808.1 cytochrome P450 [Ignavibacteria bacterium]